MSTRKEYNGWFNYETWLTNLHFDNVWHEEAREYYLNAQACDMFSKAENACIAMSEYIEQDLNDCLDASDAIPENLFLQDIINAFMSEVNFYEIAKHYIDQAESEYK